MSHTTWTPKPRSEKGNKKAHHCRLWGDPPQLVRHVSNKNKIVSKVSCISPPHSATSALALVALALVRMESHQVLEIRIKKPPSEENPAFEGLMLSDGRIRGRSNRQKNSSPLTNSLVFLSPLFEVRDADGFVLL